MSKYRQANVELDTVLNMVNEVNVASYIDPKELIQLNHVAEKLFLRAGRLDKVQAYSDGRKVFTLKKAGY